MIDDAALKRDALTPAGPGFTAGLITGGLIGCALALAFSTRSGIDLRQRVAGAARDLGAAAARGQGPTPRDNAVTG